MVRWGWLLPGALDSLHRRRRLFLNSRGAPTTVYFRYTEEAQRRSIQKRTRLNANYLMLLAIPPLLLSGWLEAQSVSRLAVEFSKPRAYQGETVTCHFVLYSSSRAVETEVAKFPEFRGFWSENTALRQGPALLLPDPLVPGKLKTIVGSYQITPMVGFAEPKILPMKLVVKSMADFTSEESLLQSELSRFEVLPLPPVPLAEKPYFKGTVGKVYLRSETDAVRFFPKEPALLRYILNGSANFSDSTQLPLTLPSGVQLLSERSSAWGPSGNQGKVFEYFVMVEATADVVIPPVDYTYFDPELKRYQRTQAPAVRLEYSTRPPEPLDLPLWGESEIEPQWSQALPFHQTRVFWAIQCLLGLLWIAIAGRKSSNAWRHWQSTHPRAQLLAQWKTLFQEPSSDSLEWLERACDLAYSTLKWRSKQPLPTRRKAIDFARTTWGESTAGVLKTLFSYIEKARYSLNSTSPLPAEGQRDRIHALYKRLLERRPKKRP
jgi:hypothetical protein